MKKVNLIKANFLQSITFRVCEEGFETNLGERKHFNRNGERP